MGRVRRVFGVTPARHNEHRFYLLRFKPSEVPLNAKTTLIGPHGQRHVMGVLVRADHAKPVTVRAERSGGRGRPKTVHRGRPRKAK